MKQVGAAQLVQFRMEECAGLERQIFKKIAINLFKASARA